MTPGDKVSVPSTIYENKRVSGVLLDITPMSPGQRTTHFSYRVKTNEGVSFYSRDELEVDRRDG